MSCLQAALTAAASCSLQTQLDDFPAFTPLGPAQGGAQPMAWQRELWLPSWQDGGSWLGPGGCAWAGVATAGAGSSRLPPAGTVCAATEIKADALCSWKC